MLNVIIFGPVIKRKCKSMFYVMNSHVVTMGRLPTVAQTWSRDMVHGAPFCGGCYVLGPHRLLASA